VSVVLGVADARVHFGGVKAVDGIDLELEEGVLYGIVGPNGSGKSTLLAAISGLVRLTSGSLTFEGHEYHRDPVARIARRGLARTFQTVRLLPALSVLENVMLGADNRIAGRSITLNWLAPWRTLRCEREARRAALGVIERLGLQDFRKRYPSTLSYGVQRRVEIARALASEPKLLMLDEPTAGMSHAERADIAELLCELRDHGLTQVLVEHDLQMITDVCSEIAVMNFGRKIASGEPTTVVRLPAVQEAYLGEKAADATS
jgi:branched-chain amino acid transport system ATP-binding protein